MPAESKGQYINMVASVKAYHAMQKHYRYGAEVKTADSSSCLCHRMYLCLFIEYLSKHPPQRPETGLMDMSAKKQQLHYRFDKYGYPQK